MARWLITPANRIWLLLIGATAIALWIRVDGLSGPVVGATTLGIAWIKGRLVMLDFMELRHAPLRWRVLLEVWLVLVTALILGIYCAR